MMRKKPKVVTFLSLYCLTISTIMSPAAVVYADNIRAEVAEESMNDSAEISSQFLYTGISEEEPSFFFTRSRMKGSVEEPLKVTFFSDQEVVEARVFLPEETSLMKEQFPSGISVEEGEKRNEWIVQSKRAQNTFVLPLIFDEEGTYELSVKEATAHIEISEQEETSEEVSAEETESSDDNLSENTYEQQVNEENHVVSEVDKKASVGNDFNTIVTADNFLEYVGLSGSASVNDNIITLTEARNNQSGSMYLKNKIDSSYPFMLTGKVFLGSDSNSADGVGIGFHTDDPDSIGLIGSGFGLAGLTDIFGFKLDTYYNGTNSFPFRPDPINTGAFGSFVYMDGEWFTSYTGNDAPARSISRPSGLWKDIRIMLSEESILRIEYEDMVWEKVMPANLNNSPLSFLISASTGGVNALQQFEFETFQYSRENTTVVVNYIDNSGNKIAESKVIDGLIGDEYQTEPKVISGFTLKEMPENAFGIFKEEEQVVNYIYIKDLIDPLDPLDPLDPEVEVSPENPPVLPEDQGLISIDFVSQFNFGEVPIQADGGTYGALPQRLLNEEGTAGEERPNFVQVSDRRDDNNGWELTANLSEDGFRSTTGEPLRGARILLENTEMVTTSTNTSIEPFYRSTAILEPGNLRTLAVARNSEGRGTWIQRYGNQDTAGSSVKLDVPAGANPTADKYEATIEWQLSFTPGNG